MSRFLIVSYSSTAPHGRLRIAPRNNISGDVVGLIVQRLGMLTFSLSIVGFILLIVAMLSSNDFGAVTGICCCRLVVDRDVGIRRLISNREARSMSESTDLSLPKSPSFPWISYFFCLQCEEHTAAEKKSFSRILTQDFSFRDVPPWKSNFFMHMPLAHLIE